MRNPIVTSVLLGTALTLSACLGDGATDTNDPVADGDEVSRTTAASSTWFTYPGITCGPDSRAYFSITTAGSGYVSGDYATNQATGGGISFGGYTFTGAGNHTKTMASRYLNSYDIVKHGSVTVVSHGPGCL